jgi:hypothetical protein
MNTDEKKCPYCAEIIKLEAIICRHCRSNVSNNTNEINNAKENLHSYEEPIRVDRDFEPKWNIRLGKQVITDRDALEISNLIASGSVDIFTEIQRVGTSHWKKVREEPELMILAQKYLPTDHYQSRNTNQESGGSYFVKGLSTLISIILIVGLLITNPSKAEFIDYLNHKISGGLQRLLTKEDFNEKTKGVMSTITQGIAKLALARLIKEQNFYLFHIYEIDTTLIRLVDADIPKFKFIGVANQFIPMHAEEWKKFIAKYGNNVSNNTNTDTSSSSNTRPQVPQQTNPSQPRNDQPPSANLFQSTPPLPKINDTAVDKTTNHIEKINVFRSNDLNQLILASYQTNNVKIESIYGKIKLQIQPERGDRANARRLNDLGLLEFKKENFQLAANLFLQGSNADPSDVEIINNYAYSLLRNGQFVDSKNALEKTLLIAIDRSSAWFNLFDLLAIQDEQIPSLCGALLLGLKFVKVPERSMNFIEDQIAKEPNLIVAQRKDQALRCAKEKI